MEFFLLVVIIAVVIACERDRSYCGKPKEQLEKRTVESFMERVARLRAENPQFNEFHCARLEVACSKFENITEHCGPDSYDRAMLRAFDELDAELLTYMNEHNL